MVRLTVDYGDDVHSIEIDEGTYARIKSGEKVEITGQGFVHEEDGEVPDTWIFNSEPEEIAFYLQNGAQFFAGDSWVEE